MVYYYQAGIHQVCYCTQQAVTEQQQGYNRTTTTKSIIYPLFDNKAITEQQQGYAELAECYIVILNNIKHKIICLNLCLISQLCGFYDGSDDYRSYLRVYYFKLKTKTAIIPYAFRIPKIGYVNNIQSAFSMFLA